MLSHDLEPIFLRCILRTLNSVAATLYPARCYLICLSYHRAGVPELPMLGPTRDLKFLLQTTKKTPKREKNGSKANKSGLWA